MIVTDVGLCMPLQLRLRTVTPVAIRIGASPCAIALLSTMVFTAYNV